MASALNTILILIFAAVILGVIFTFLFKYVKSDSFRIQYDWKTVGIVKDVVTVVPMSKRKYIEKGSGDGEEEGRYFPVVEYEFHGVNFTEISMRSTQNKNEFRKGQKVNVRMALSDPHLCIASSRDMF